MGLADELNSRNQYALPSEIDWIRNHAGMFKPETCVMLGSGPGVFAVALKEGSPDSQLWIVDKDTTYYAEMHLMSFGLHGGVYPIISDSAEAGENWKGDPIDFLIVDAAHDEESVGKDIDAWFPHVKTGGFIFFHDYLEREGGFNGTDEWKPKGVYVAVRKVADDRWDFVTAVGISVVYRKVV